MVDIKKYYIKIVFKDNEQLNFTVYAYTPFLAINFLYSSSNIVVDNVKDVICESVEE